MRVHVNRRRAMVATQAMACAALAWPDAAGALSRSWFLFFDEGRVELQDRARQIIAELARVARDEWRAPPTYIEVLAHADRGEGGSPEGDRLLSLRRGASAAAELERLGFGPDRLVVVGLGSDEPLVPTHDGRVEPQNRLVRLLPR